MEAGGLIAEVGWTEFDFSFQGEETEIMAQLFGSFPSYGEGGGQELPWSDQASSAYCDSTGSSLVVPSAYEGYYLSNSNEALGISSCVGSDDLGLVQDQDAANFLNGFSNHYLSIYGNASINQVDLDDSGMSVVDSVSAANKRKHLTEEVDGQTRGRKRARKGETKGMKKAKQSGDEDTDIPITSGSPTSCCTSDSDSNASQECEARPKAKARAGRGAATEPQSIYAREKEGEDQREAEDSAEPRAQRDQDISTMLEEVVQYVKFLQLQIKLLSSDDTWMYAPIAYNGMNIGIDLNMSR
ncbi:hypothetical protein PR202_ga12020 [Eleusine coracana subsp. coracana]|uniref:Uncharacterized protein n=1 Tax=Eleusine coracana subsp. coracana TaxID=191504 RepID=A0AAV5CAS6_ELECO|nr:hypothetical protein PR202_ga12020 [Eleusine coracana subsp. coracana]